MTSRIKYYSLFFIIALFNISCGHNGQPIEMQVGGNQVTQPPDTTFGGQKDLLVLLNHGEAIIRGNIKPNSHRPKYTIPVWKGDQVTAILRPVEKGGNVRISQIEQPGGQLDGPFGDSLHYKVQSNGDLGIIISENQMAEKPYTGDFILHIKVN